MNNVKQTFESDECFDFMIYLTYSVFKSVKDKIFGGYLSYSTKIVTEPDKNGFY